MQPSHSSLCGMNQLSHNVWWWNSLNMSHSETVQLEEPVVVTPRCVCVCACAMRVRVCVCVCVRVCVHTSARQCIMDTCLQADMLTYQCTCLQADMLTYQCLDISMSWHIIDTCTHTYVYMHSHIYIHALTHMYTCIHTYVYTQRDMQRRRLCSEQLCELLAPASALNSFSQKDTTTAREREGTRQWGIERDRDSARVRVREQDISWHRKGRAWGIFFLMLFWTQQFWVKWRKWVIIHTHMTKMSDNAHTHTHDANSPHGNTNETKTASYPGDSLPGLLSILAGL